jgi:hypothetical protein
MEYGEYLPVLAEFDLALGELHIRVDQGGLNLFPVFGQLAGGFASPFNGVGNDHQVVIALAGKNARTAIRGISSHRH